MAARTLPDETCTSGFRIEIKCDQCGVEAPPADAILKGHGLNNMGWHCSGGTHVCPAHSHPKKGKSHVQQP